MARKPSTNVTKNPKGGWKVTKGGKQVSNHRTQKTAISNLMAMIPTHQKIVTI